jgi:hypothetical protein
MRKLLILLVFVALLSCDKNEPQAVNQQPAVAGDAIAIRKTIAAPIMGDQPLLDKGLNARVSSVTYHGGAIIKNVKVYAIYLGSAWKGDATMTNVNNFLTYIASSNTLLNDLSQYSTATYPIGKGSFIGSLQVDDTRTTLNDTDIQASITSLISQGKIPAWDANTLYYVFTQKGTKVVFQGVNDACSPQPYFCGYHSAFANGTKYYAVSSHPSCQVCGASGHNTLMDNFTITIYHEICEAVTDPVNAWWDPVSGNEIGDFCRTSKVSGSYNVQTMFSNKTHTCQ